MVKHQAMLDGVFGALSDPVRRTIVERLARGERTAGEIAASFSISQPAVSRHIKVLERSGLVTRTVVGREHHLRITPRALVTASRWLERQRAFWDSSFDRLEHLLEQTSDKDTSP